MTTAHDHMHMSYCPDLGACVGIGGNGERAACRNFEAKLRQAEDDRAHEEAQRLLSMHMETLLVHGAQVAQGLALAITVIDPYVMRDGFLVHKVTGRVVAKERSQTP